MEAITILILILGVCLGFFVQSIVGFAAVLVAVPIILTVLSLQESIALMSIFLPIFSVILIYKNWKFIDKRIIGEIIIGLF